MADNSKLESQAFRLKDIESLRRLFAELNYEFADEPVYKKDWNQELKETVVDSRIIAKKHDFLIYYIKTERESTKHWKQVATKIISENNGFCLVCTHNPTEFQWIFSTLSKEYSKSFSETRHIPIEIKPSVGIPKPFLEFLEAIEIEEIDKGVTILGKIAHAFDKFSLQIHDELTVNVFEALKTLSDGIISDKNNNLELNDQSLNDIRSPIFIFLYRIIFVLYAEDRAIFPVENKIYYEECSVKWIKQNWLLNPETSSKLGEYEVQNHLKKLFHLIEVGSESLGYSPEEFSMRSYYGRLFDRKINSELEKWKIPNKQLLDALRLITGTRDRKGNFFFLDYSALETRHLGSIYEHLLEYHLTIKNKKIADLPDQEDRKTSASYYTPDYIVEYIVNSTLEPIITRIIDTYQDKNVQLEKILSLKILDPAMGSGHFLIGVINHLAKRLCEIEFGEVREKELLESKREVVRRCIYGVDINPLAVDLAKLSLWLETLSSDKPLTFLSAHLKNGNSLMGESISTIYDTKRTLFETHTISYLKKTVKEFLGFETLEDDTPSTVKAKLEKYEKMQKKGTSYHQLRGILDHKISELSGLKILPWRSLRQKIGEESLDFYSSDSGESVHQLRQQCLFFHWELEFPEIFFDQNGEKRSDAGFDVVVGNPPYIKVETVKGFEKKFMYENFESAKKRFDLYILFLEKGLKLLKPRGYLGFITPNKFLKTENAKNLRGFISKSFSIKRLIDFGSLKVFRNVTSYPCISIIQNSKNTKNGHSSVIKVKKLSENLIQDLSPHQNKNSFENEVVQVWKFDQTVLSSEPWLFLSEEQYKILEKLRNSSEIKLNDISEKIFEGLISGDNSIYFIDHKIITKYKIESELVFPVPKARNVRKYAVKWDDRFVIYPYQKNNEITKRPIELEEFPHAKKYFEKFKDSLSNRQSMKRTKKNWYEMVEPRQFYRFNQDKIIFPHISAENNFTVDFADNKLDEYFFIDHDCYGIILKNKNQKDYLYLLALLNSKLIEFFITTQSSEYSGRYFSYQTQFLEDIPILEMKKTERGKIIYLVNEILKEKRNNRAIDELQQEIDEKIFNLYNISKKEQKIIKEFLNQ